MGKPEEIDELSFKINCSLMLFGKNASLPLDVIDLADFPSADPDDVGKYRNDPFGNLKKIVCPWTVAGWASTLVSEITAAATSFDVTDASTAPAVPFNAYLDNEWILVGGKSGNTLSSISRAQGGTTAVIHNKGAIIYEKRADFEAEVSRLPIKSIGDVYVKRGSSEWLRVVSGVTKYINSDGRAKLVFSDKVKYEEKTNLTSPTSTDTGTHPHAASSSTPGNQTKKCIPTGAGGGMNPGNIIDGNDDSYGAWAGAGTMEATFTEIDLGTIIKQYVWVKLGVAQSTITVKCGGTILGSTAAVTGWQRKTKVGGVWGDKIELTGSNGGNICETYKEVEYTPTVTTNVTTHAADGVSATTTLGGNSVANMMIGDLVACDVEGYMDDASGTYTGTPYALIERPDHVRKYILMAFLGFAAGDIGSSFATVGDIYAARITGGYKLAFVMHEVAKEAMDLFEAIDFQTRSNMFESGGEFKLVFNSIDEPTSQKTFDLSNIKGMFKFSKTEVADIKNKLRVYYFRDYSKSGSLGESYQKVDTSHFDTPSIAKYGGIFENIEFSCIGDLFTMVDDVSDWIILQKKEFKKIVEFEAFWDAMILEHCDYFTVNANFWSGFKYKTLELIERPEDQKIEIQGQQFVAS